ncbi:hypothetical protein RISK_002982 [Rhodopirellula islandica]|uniref:Uncharacterized protein n=1 Tax=Rhodopirellula islandica TaxID=595434 RepID=A0A0J1EHJ9_RHOIS|nr:hypothetical protein RISK_002982 [Rhodopirellula islandica]
MAGTRSMRCRSGVALLLGPAYFSEQASRSLSALELFWQTSLFPRPTGANARTAHMVVSDHSCPPA